MIKKNINLKITNFTTKIINTKKCVTIKKPNEINYIFNYTTLKIL